ncbi:hypothetical protein CU633_01790 [Bacillus sp. V3-13]|uniref:hypothetical protein n=1 Tax=Bacillus sp. V3-13 TaxID=2053728 RepID=UPI000C78F0F3|nr:hypothetical protein [Bacillus sp. V3-13]PLR79126.1 hypothetical protein CU633_01790 [Bacillus sp. V3-13]
MKKKIIIASGVSVIGILAASFFSMDRGRADSVGEYNPIRVMEEVKDDQPIQVSISYTHNNKRPSVDAENFNSPNVISASKYLADVLILPAETLKNPKDELEQKQRLVQLVLGVNVDVLQDAYDFNEYPKELLASELDIKLKHLEEMKQYSTNDGLNKIILEAETNFKRAVETNNLEYYFKAKKDFENLSLSLNLKN